MLGEYLEEHFNRPAVGKKSVNFYKFYLAPWTIVVYNMYMYISQFIIEYCEIKGKEFPP